MGLVRILTPTLALLFCQCYVSIIELFHNVSGILLEDERLKVAAMILALCVDQKALNVLTIAHKNALQLLFGQ